MGLIAVGGMGEVRRTWDVELDRAVAMKILRPELCERPDLVDRFIEEAQATGQLEHPGIVPIYDIGELPDGRPYFTMKEIRGRTLLEVIEELHSAAGPDGWGVTATGLTFQRVIQILGAVCEAVAYAHSRGVLHRDLKPTNVMVGAFGEVVVMDWGLAKVARHDGFGDSVAIGTGAQRVMTRRSHKPAYVTRSGAVAGTPNYMPPEQAMGDAARIGPWSDVYALGAILYEILTDRSPYLGDDLDTVVEAVLAGPPPPPTVPWQSPDTEAPEDGLRAICRKAMARDLAERFMDASALAEAITSWLDATQVREQAVALVRRADRLEPDMVRLRKEAATLRSRAQELLMALPAGAPPEAKRASWALEDRAAALDDEYLRHEARYVHLLRAALTNHPGLPQARERLRRLSESTGARFERLEGPGYVSLYTDVPARVRVRRIAAVHRRLQARDEVHDGPAPLDRLALPPGSYQIDLSAEGHDTVRYLVAVESGRLHEADPPGPARPSPIVLPPVGADPEGTVRIPRGWAYQGGDPERSATLPRSRVWVPTFRIQRHPVTVRAYLAFLHALADHGHGHLLRELAPATWPRPLEPGPDVGDDQPIRDVPFEAAHAFARWRADTTGLPWRLPTEREWERAARGVDERRFPWGDHIDPGWCCYADSHRGDPVLPSVHAFPRDESPWGVRGMGGTVSDWVVADGASTATVAAPEHRFVRGGHWLAPSLQARCALRFRMPGRSHPGVGFRLVCAIE
jgi:serine/threonine-protein kinase